MTCAPTKGAQIISLVERQIGQSPSTRLCPPNQHHLAEPLRQLERLRDAIARWDDSGGVGSMPQPADYGLRLPRNKPSQIDWQAVAS